MKERLSRGSDQIKTWPGRGLFRLMAGEASKIEVPEGDKGGWSLDDAAEHTKRSLDLAQGVKQGSPQFVLRREELAGDVDSLVGCKNGQERE
jgi:hypothetical protein